MKSKKLSVLIITVMLTITSAATKSMAQEDTFDIFIHYLGHSSFVLQFDNNVTVLTDYGQSRAYGLDSPIYDIGNFTPTIITYSHHHPDHYDPERAPDSVQYVLENLDSLTINGLIIKPVRVSEQSLNQADNTSFLFIYKGYTICHLADAQANIINIQNEDNKNHLRQIFPENIDLLLMTVEGVTQFIPQAETFIDFIKPRRVIPIHYWSQRYKNEFLAYLDNQNQVAGTNYQIDRRRGAKLPISTAANQPEPVKIYSLEPAAYAPYLGPEIWYNYHELDDSQGNGNGKIDSGETAKLVVTIANTGLDADNVIMTLASQDPGIKINQATAQLGSIGIEQNGSNSHEPFSLSVNPAVEAHPATFLLTISADAGYTVSDSFTIIIGNPPILIVDDDCGDLCETHLLKALEPVQIYADTWNISTAGCPSINQCQAYQAVIWLTGNDRSTTLVAEEQSVIVSLLEGGGKLLITGQDIGYDLVQSGSTADSIFYANYLHAQFIADSAGNSIARGVTGDPIVNGVVANFVGQFGGAGNQTAPDVIAALAPAQTMMTYIPSFAGAALRYEDQVIGSRLVYLAFGLEGIAGPRQDSASDLIKRIVTWLTDIPAEIDASAILNLPESCVLLQNYPNPFNAGTTIRYVIPRPAFVSLKIYNITGQELATLHNEKQEAGTYQLVFDGQNYPSGIYFFQLKAGTFIDTKKFILMR